MMVGRLLFLLGRYIFGGEVKFPGCTFYQNKAKMQVDIRIYLDGMGWSNRGSWAYGLLALDKVKLRRECEVRAEFSPDQKVPR